MLEKSLKESIKPVETDLKIDRAQINLREVQNFLAMEKEVWKGLPIIELFHVKQSLFSYRSCIPLIRILSYPWDQ
ncbi:MAG: hypothetical protein JSW35_08370 [Deltaproteobacteria bacterium]|nr:MAG: hypothetical protein JSW35_08370 [Deltaproteobacteria bacterium]